MGIIPLNFSVGKGFLNMIQNPGATKEKTEYVNFFKALYYKNHHKIIN